MSHPLFPREHDEDEDERDIAWIHVTRFERSGQVYHPRLFDAKELTSLEDISAQFGGGQYEVIGRNEDRSRVTARHRWSLPGPSIPFVASADPGPPPVAAPAGLSGDHSLFAMIMQQSQASTAALMQMMMQMSQQSTQIMVAALSRDKGEGSAVVNAIAQMAGKDKELLAALLAKVGGNDKSDVLVRGMEMGLKMAEANAKDAEDDTMGSIVEGMQAAASVMAAAGGASPAPGFGGTPK